MEFVVAAGVIVLLASLLLPAGFLSGRRVKELHCVRNLKGLSVASALYGTDHNGKWPPNEVSPDGNNRVFSEALLPYLGPVPRRPASDFMESPFICPLDRPERPDTNWVYRGVYAPLRYGLSYAQNASLQVATPLSRAGERRQLVEQPSQLMLYIDFTDHYMADHLKLQDNARKAKLKQRHGGHLNVAYADGSVRSIPMASIPSTAPSPFWQGRNP